MNNSFDDIPLNNFDKESKSKRVVYVILFSVLTVSLIAGLFFLSKKDERTSSHELTIDVVTDADNDGLIDFFEELYGTDITSSDSDGDGYSDSDELRDGFDPLGDGKIVQKPRLSLIDINMGVERGKCEGITGEMKKYDCYRDLAMYSQNYKICELIDDNSLRNICYSIVGKSKKDIGACKKIVLDEVWTNKDTCYSILATALEDSSVCEKVSEANSEECYRSVARKIKDESLCKKVTDKKERNKCIGDVARVKKDFSICGKIPDPINLLSGNTYTVNTCYSDYGVMTGDVRACEKISKKDYDEEYYLFEKNSCFSSVANVTGDPTICEFVEGELYKKNCLSYSDCQKSADVDQCLTNKQKIGEVTNATHCLKMEKPYSVKTCFLKLAREQENINYCYLNQSSEDFFYCYNGMKY